MANPNYKKNFDTPEVKEKRKATHKKRQQEGLPTMKERVFAEVWVRTRSVKEAGEAAGVSYPEIHGHAYLKKPRVKNYVDKLVAEIEKKELARASKEIVEERREAKITRTDVLQRLWQLANCDPLLTNKSITGQVKAADSLAEILGMKIKQIRDVTNTFDGWTDDELEHYATTGTVPERFRK